MNRRAMGALCCAALMLASCARPLPERRVLQTPAPGDLPPRVVSEGVEIAALPLDTRERSEAAFGADVKPAGVLPVFVSVVNAGSRDVVVSERDMAAIAADGTVSASLTAEDVVERARHASRGTTAAGKVAIATAITLLVLVALAGGGRVDPFAISNPQDRNPMYAENWKAPKPDLAAGGAPAASGDAGRAPEHRWVLRGSFGERSLVPGDRAEGFVFVPWGSGSTLRVNIHDVAAASSRAIDIPLVITRTEP